MVEWKDGQNSQKIDIHTDGKTDRQTDGETDGKTDGRTENQAKKDILLETVEKGDLGIRKKILNV